MISTAAEAQWEEILAPIEAERKQIHQQRKIYAWAMIACAVVIAVSFVLLLDPSMKNAPAYQTSLALVGEIGGVALLIYLAIKRSKLYDNYQKRLRAHIIQPLLAQLFPSLHYHPEAWVEKNAYEQSGLCGEVLSKYEGEDLLAGKVGNFDMQISELKTYRRGSESNMLVFSGHFGIAKLSQPLHISDELLILHQKAHNWSGGNNRPINTGSKKEIFSPSPTFNQHYKVFVAGEQQAAQVLPADFCDWLVKIAHLRISLSLKPNYIAYTWAEAGDLLATDPAHELNAAHIKSFGREVQAKIRVFERVYDFLQTTQTEQDAR